MDIVNSNPPACDICHLTTGEVRSVDSVYFDRSVKYVHTECAREHAKKRSMMWCNGCGRQMRPHCPICGSYRCYALATATTVVTRMNGRKDAIVSYRCTRCKNVFTDDDWQFHCGAPPEHIGRPKNVEELTNAKAKIGDLADQPEAMQAALDEILKKRKIRGE